MDEHNPQARKDMNAAKPPRSRWLLHMQASMWRFLMGLGMLFHKLAPPRPPKPNFTRTVQSTISGKAGTFTMQLYVPKDYNTQKNLWMDRPQWQDRIEEEEDEEANIGGLGSMGRRAGRRISATFDEVSRSVRRRSQSARRWGGYPVVINFHGGGFTLGTATDDARRCGTVVDECNAVVVSVDYRLAPENPFPTAVEDGVDAVLWINEHAEELGIDREKIALSGFSSGGNMAFTVPLRLYDEQTGFQREGETTTTLHTAARERLQHHGAVSTYAVPTLKDTATTSAPPTRESVTADSASSSSTRVPPGAGDVETLDPAKPPPRMPMQRMQTKGDVRVKEQEARSIPDVNIRCIVPWYPSLDYTRTREQRRATTLRKDQELPALFTDLFDESYLHPPQTIAMDSPYLSPGVAPTDLLKNALPEEIIMHTCEWDMLLDEGQAFRDRLISKPLMKKVWYKMVEGVPHGWDKAPNPWKPTPGVREHYLQACKELRRVFGPQPGVLKERPTKDGPSAAPRGSVSVVR